MLDHEIVWEEVICEDDESYSKQRLDKSQWQEILKQTQKKNKQRIVLKNRKKDNESKLNKSGRVIINSKGILNK